MPEVDAEHPSESETVAPSCDLYGALLPELERRFAAAPGWSLSKRDPDPEFRLRESRGIRLEAGRALAELEGDPILDLRMVRIAGPSVDVVNVMGFPLQPTHHPIFATELLAFGGAGRIAFVDLQDGGLGSARREQVVQGCAAALARVRSAPSWPVPEGELPEAPAWALQDSSGHALFLRGDGARCHSAMHCLAFRAYLETWLKIAAEPGRSELVEPGQGRSDGPEDDGASLIKLKNLHLYKQHHLANTPGTPFLSRLYGEAWTARFQRDFLYV